ncbi:MAG: hypothetical protein HWE39_14900 [Oceanospirillaceae bacterium]|nr:hypothetical protein [Oceanospirillaceae bacterium]
MSSAFTPDATGYPERRDPDLGWRQSLERWLLAWPARLGSRFLKRELARLESGAGDSSVSSQVLREGIRLEGLNARTLPQWYAGMRRRGEDREVLAGALALIRGMAVQCDTPALQASVLALVCETKAMSGRAVHVLTPDDATTRQLESRLQTLLQPSGLRLARVLGDTPVRQRPVAYRASVTVVSVREALRDYLGDRIALNRTQGEITRKLARLLDRDPLQSARMCGLPFGIVVDGNRSLVEQACEPMIIAGRTGAESARLWAATALGLAEGLEEAVHYGVSADNSIDLTAEGRRELARRGADLASVWGNASRRDFDVTLALQALRFKSGQQYRVADQQIEFPPGAAQSDEMLHLLEVREGIPVTGHRVIRGKLTYQRFFRRYEELAAICGDLRGIRSELWNIYGLAGFCLTAPAGVAEAGAVPPLGKGDERVVRIIAALSEAGGKRARAVLLARRIRHKRRADARLRRSLLRYDKQLENITAFSGRAE